MHKQTIDDSEVMKKGHIKGRKGIIGTEKGIYRAHRAKRAHMV